MPDALARKYPRAATSWSWFWLFPASQHSRDPVSGIIRRHHLYPQSLQRAIRQAVQELLGHADVATTMIYTHVLNQDGRDVISPLDR